MDGNGKWVSVAKRAAIKPGDVVGVTLGEREIALYNIDGAIYATDNLCTHAFAFLSQGWLDGDCIECPLHGGRFEVKTGKGLGPPINDDLKTYKVQVAGEDVQIQLD
ncbi:MAG TPA: non-heme iron oxygenase ferredoxin subunit [Stellaceae bacterium]|jgi:naphthalene 1,2-dioxygenase ferredoxin component|nr:non-heme iron oxygenase ferredoxin subunit [Stellaceae bacterium]